MGKTIDEKIVKMSFDNKKFESGVKESMNSIKNLKNSLKFKDSANELKEFGEKADNAFVKLAGGADGVVASFSHMQMTIQHQLDNLVDKVVSAATRMAKSLSTDQISAGWSKFSNEAGYIQTIMNATGLELEDIQDRLKMLSWYSDETSYSLDSMTSALSQMLTAGGDIDSIIPLIEGIANATAFAGKGAAEFQRTIFNLTQSYSAGALTALDWKSVMGAGTNSKVLVEELIRAGEELGKIKKDTVTTANFTETLKDKWADTEVMERAFGRFASATTEIYDIIENQNRGYELAAEVIRDYGGQMDELGVKAFKAAQETKTFSEAIDATKDAVSTAWSDIFKVIFGDFYETKAMWSDLTETLYESFAMPLKRGRDVLEKVMTPSWKRLTNMVKDAGYSVEEFEKRITSELEREGVPINDLINQYGSLEKALQHIGNYKELVINTINSFVKPITSTSKAISNAVDELKDMQNIVDKVIKGDFGNGVERINALNAAGYNSVLVQKLVDKVWIRNGKTWKDTTITAEDMAEVFGNLTDAEKEQAGVTDEMISVMQQLADKGELTEEQLKELIGGVFDPENMGGRELFLESIKNVYHGLSSITGALKDAWQQVFPPDAENHLKNFLVGFWKLTNAIKPSVNTVDKLTRIFRGLFSVIGLIKDVISAVVSVAFKPFAKATKLAGNGVLDLAARMADAIYNFRNFLHENDLITIAVQKLIDIFHKLSPYVKSGFNSFKSMDWVKNGLEYLWKIAAKAKTKFKEMFDIIYNGFKEGRSISEIFTNVFSVISNSFSNVIHRVFPGIDTFMDSVKDRLAPFKEFGEFIIEGLWEGIKKGYIKIKKVVINLATMIKDVFCDLMGIHSPSDYFIWIGKMIVEGFVIGIKSLVGVCLFIGKLFGTMWSFIQKNFLNNLPSFKRITSNAFNKVKDVISSCGESVSEFFSKIPDNISKVGDSLEKSGAEKFLNVLILIVDKLTQLTAAVGFAKLGEGVQKVGDGVYSATKKIGQGFKLIANALSIKYLGESILALTASVALVVGIIYLISKLPEDQLKGFDAASKRLGNIIYYIVGGLSVLLGAMALMNKFQKVKPEKTANSLAGLAGVIIAMSIAAVVIIKLIKTVNDMIKVSDANNFKDAAIKLLEIFGILSGVAIVISLINAVGSRFNKDVDAGNNLTGAAFTILGISLSLLVIVEAIKRFYNEIMVLPDKAALYDSINTIMVLVLALGAASGIISLAGGGKGGMAGAMAILILVNSLSMIADGFKHLTDVVSGINEADLTMALAVFGGFVVGIGIILGLGAIYKDSGKNLIALSIIVGEFIGLIAVLTFCMSQMNSMNEFSSNMFVATVALLAVIFAEIAGLFFIASRVKEDDAKSVTGVIDALSVMIFTLIGMVGMFTLMASIIDQVQNPDTVYLTILTMLGGIVLIIGMIMGIISSANAVLSNHAEKLLYAITAMLASITLSIGAIAFIIDKVGGNKVLGALGIVALMTALIVGVIASISLIQKVILSGVTDTSKTIALIAAAAAMLLAMGGILAVLSLFPQDQITAAGNALVAMTVIMILAVAALGVITALITPVGTGAIAALVAAFALGAIGIGVAAYLISLAFDKLREIFTDESIVDDLETMGYNMGKGFTLFLFELAHGFADAITEIIGKFLKAGKELWDSFWGGFRGESGVDTKDHGPFMSFMLDFVNHAGDIVRGIADKLAGIGRDILNFLFGWTGLDLGNMIFGEDTKSLSKPEKEATDNLVKWSKDTKEAVQNEFDTHSNSKWSEQVGKWVLGGFVDGINEDEDKTVNATTSVASRIKNAFGGMFDGINTDGINIKDRISDMLGFNLDEGLTTSITPVLDMSEFGGANELMANFGGVNFDSATISANDINANLVSSFDTTNSAQSLMNYQLNTLINNTNYIRDNMDKLDITLDGDVLVGKTAIRMNNALGNLVTYRGRGN